MERDRGRTQVVCFFCMFSRREVLRFVFGALDPGMRGYLDENNFQVGKEVARGTERKREASSRSTHACCSERALRKRLTVEPGSEVGKTYLEDDNDLSPHARQRETLQTLHPELWTVAYTQYN